MADLEIEATQYESPNEVSGNARGSNLYESPSPFHPPCGKRQRASGIEDPDYVLEQPVYDHWKLNILIYTIEVIWITLSTFFVKSLSMLKCPTIIFSRSRGKGFKIKRMSFREIQKLDDPKSEKLRWVTN
jgi:hypothetical protein